MLFRSLKMEGITGSDSQHDREQLLALWGIGAETADSILLYAYQLPYFVVDAYTQRLLSRLGVTGGGESYDQLQLLVAGSLPCEYELYSEFHALIVRQAKSYCRRKPLCADCPLRARCNYFSPEQV